MAISALNIPSNLQGNWSYSGMGQPYQDFTTNTVMPTLSNLIGNYQTTTNQAYDDASSGIGTLTKNALTPAIQSTINSLAGRGMINSSVAGDALSKTASNVANSVLASQQDLATNRANAMTSGYSDLLTNLAELGRYSQSGNDATSYQIMANLLSGLM